MHSNSNWHFKILGKHQIFICRITIQARSTANANLNILIDAGNSVRKHTHNRGREKQRLQVMIKFECL